MSTYWGVHCMTCDDDFGPHGNHQDKAAVALAELAPKLAQVAAILPGMHIELSDSFDFYAETGRVMPIDWFAKHAGHDIQAYNEYGETKAQYDAKWAKWEADDAAKKAASGAAP